MTDRHHPVSSRFQRFFMRLLVLLVAAWLAAYFATERGQHAMRPSVFASSPGVLKPLIDTVAPKQVATATFAMG
jgi:hypothetical protein